jgi:hypothetical protein
MTLRQELVFTLQIEDRFFLNLNAGGGGRVTSKSQPPHATLPTTKLTDRYNIPLLLEGKKKF